MSKRLRVPKGYAALEASIELLSSDLVWSDDFEIIRANLRLWLQDEAKKGANRYAIAIAEALVSVEDDITIPNPVR